VTAWLDELDGPGAFNGKMGGLGANHFYNHFQCAPGVPWVVDALGEDNEVMNRAAKAAGGVGREATQFAAIRRVIPWSRVNERIARKARKLS
jgi:hypothetical protein